MAEAKTIALTHKEVVEALIKHQGIKEGIWQLYVEFALAAANIQFGPDETNPAAVIPIKIIGLTKVDKVGPLAVDASALSAKPVEVAPSNDKEEKETTPAKANT